MGKKTPFYNKHLDSDGKIVDFSGWDMPLHYGSQLAEHNLVREDAGLFDVSHMTIIEIEGEQAKAFLQRLVTNDVDKLETTGKALYTCMCNERGGIIDDLIVYFVGAKHYRLIVNAATRDKDIDWIQTQAQSFNVTMTERSDLAMLAVQGPSAVQKALSVIPSSCAKAGELAPFEFILAGDWFVARTGYTGEDGFEMVFPENEAEAIWDALLAAGVKPCGLGARDTLRLEAGLNLYGTDMTDETTPLESNLGWTVTWQPDERDFIGRDAIAQQKAQGTPRRLVGFVLEVKGVLRGHMPIFAGETQVGEITSGTFSPTLKKSVAMARVTTPLADEYHVEMRGKRVPLRRVKPNFVRKGKSLID